MKLGKGCYLLRWIERFSESVERNTKPKIMLQVTRGATDVQKGSTKKIRKEQSDWVITALRALEKLTDESTSTKILVETCPHSYPKKRIKEMKAKLEEYDDLDKLLEFMRTDTSWGGGSFYDYPHREGMWIHVTKVPYNPKAYEAATTKEEKLKAYCHCSLAKINMEKMPALFCSCSGGWVKQLWEGVLDVPLEVILSESLLKGDERCTHSFLIPTSLLREKN